MSAVVRWEVEFEQVGSLVTPDQAAVIIAVAVVVFAILSYRFVRLWRKPRTLRSN